LSIAPDEVLRERSTHTLLAVHRHGQGGTLAGANAGKGKRPGIHSEAVTSFTVGSKTFHLYRRWQVSRIGGAGVLTGKKASRAIIGLGKKLLRSHRSKTTGMNHNTGLTGLPESPTHGAVERAEKEIRIRLSSTVGTLINAARRRLRLHGRGRRYRQRLLYI